MRRLVSAGLTLALAWTFGAAGCYRTVPTGEEPPPKISAPKPSIPSQPVGKRQAGSEERAPSENTPFPTDLAAGTDRSSLPPVSGGPPGEMTSTLPSEEVHPGEDGRPRPPAEPSGGETGRLSPPAAVPADAMKGAVREEAVLPENAPLFVREKEELVYRVEFLGLTMGFARFRFEGMASVEGKMAYRLTVRAWTSDLLAVFYPMNDTIEYYLDVETLAPIRQEFTNSRQEDDIASYDQKSGEIVYRYKKDGKVRKRVEAVPGVYDPVSMVYYFRTRKFDGEESSHPMYAGRKLWEVSAKPMGVETIRTERGQFDTLMIEPVLRTGGKQEHAGNIRVWMTRDPRHIPVRLYAKFKKIRTWTLVGILLPDRQGG